MGTTLRLYSYFRSSCSYRVRIALALKQLPYEYVGVHLLNEGGEQNKSEYLARNPMGEVPALELLGEGGEQLAILGQSMAILEYLEERHPTPALLPSDALARAKVRQIAESINASIQPIQNLRVMLKLREQFGVDREATVKWNHYWIDRGFGGVEALLQKTAGAYAFGDAPTLADAFLVPQHYNAVRFGVDMSQFPTIQRVCDAANALEAFQAAAPDKQPDAPVE